MNDAGPTVTSSNIDEYIRKLRVVRDKRKQVDDEYAKLEAMLVGVVLKYLQDNKMSSTKTSTGYSASWYPKITYKVVDPGEFRRHVIGNEAWELIDWRCNATGAKDFMAEHGDVPPPGVQPNQTAVVRVTPPARPKLEGATTHVEDYGNETIPWSE